MTLSVVEPTRPQESVPDLMAGLRAGEERPGRLAGREGVELGVARLLPVVTQRTIVDKLNLDRMRRISSRRRSNAGGQRWPGSTSR